MKKSTPSFILTLKLNPEIYQEDILGKRLNSGRQLFNIILGKALNIQKKLKSSYEYNLLISEYNLEKKIIKAKNLITSDKLKILQSQFHDLNSLYGLTEYNLHSLVKIFRTQFHNDIDSLSAQKIATRVFNAVMKYHYGKGGRPRFNGYGKFKSLEGKSNTSGIRFINNKLIWGKDLEIPVILKEGDVVQDYALTKKIKYVRIVKKTIRKKVVYSVQLILEGEAYNKFEAAKGKVGIDLGPQTIAYVSKNGAGLKVLAEKINKINKEKKSLERKLSKKLRLLNPNAFEKNFKKGNKNKLGKAIKGAKCTNISKSYKKLRTELNEIERKQAELRKESHGALINELLRLGREFYMEKISYKAWQKMFGRSIGIRAPGLFVSMLRRKAEKAGGKVTEFNTQTTALSQVCICKRKVKKPLSQRWHICECGVISQRDLFSAYLAMFVVKNLLDYIAAESCYTGFEQRLWLATKDIQNLSSSSVKILGLSKVETESLANLMLKKNLTVSSI